MIEPVQIFNDLATAAGYHFIYGGSQYLNYELSLLTDLPAQKEILFLFPVIESVGYVGGRPDVINAECQIMLGRKFEATTFSSLDETEKQKYDRRLADLRAKLVVYLNSVSCGSDLEFTNARIAPALNQFAENIDGMQAQLTFVYDNE